MKGRIKAQRIAAQASLGLTAKIIPICPLCLREIPKSQQDAHHLVPKSKGGRETQLLHRICHRQIHALYSETQLERELNSVEALLAQEPMQAFIRWVSTKPPSFYERSFKSQARRR